jgi:hypothetical protein
MLRSIRFFGVIIYTVLIATPLQAQVPTLAPQEPQLRIDPGMHVGAIRSIGVDARCTLLVTGSSDKTTRLWRLPKGELLQTLRPPIGDGEDGKVFAVAVAPDGKLVAIGRNTGRLRSERGGQVYIFKSNSGEVVRRLEVLKFAVNHLVFSADGKYLAATLWGGLGLKVWETAQWHLVAEDKDYGGKASYGAAFDRKGTLYTVAFDGKLRRYAVGYSSKPTSTTVRGGEKPYSVAVHPTGNLVAVGFDDTRTVEVYDSTTLAKRFTPDTESVNNGSLPQVAWSADGTRLYASGQYGNDSERIIRIWGRGGAGPAREVNGSVDTITHMLPCGDGIAIGAFDPAFGLLAADDSRRLWQNSVQADMRSKLNGDFTVSADGLRIRFGLKRAAGEPVLFDLATEKLSDAPEALPGLYAGDTQSLPVTDWLNRYDPKLDGMAIKLEDVERAHSFAIAPDKRSFILGTDFYLRAYDNVGKPAWSLAYPAPGIAWGVNIAREGKLVVAAYGDGTIRWHRMTDGKELLALFVQAKDRRWVAWTPLGYYTASPGGEGLIGWHINRGWSEAADFFPAHRFRNRFYRPDIVRLVLTTLDEDKAVAEVDKLANSELQERNILKLQPPVLEIFSPKDGDHITNPHVTLQYGVRSPTGENISNVDVYLDDEKLNARGFVPVRSDIKEAAQIDLTLPRRNVKVTVIARSGDKASVPRSVHLTWTGTTADAKPQPRLLALLIGVSGYNQQALKLVYAHQDALNLDAALKAQEGKAFMKVETKVLINADSASIRKGFDWLNDTAREGDLTLILLSGHGTTRNNTFFFLPADADPANLSATAISGHEIVGTVSGLPGGKLLLIDACRAGGGLVPVGMSQVPVDMNKLANDMGQPVGAIFFGSSSVGEYSYEDSKLKAGVFTAALIEGLSGKADLNGDGKIETDEMGVWLRKRVPDLTEQKQHPLRHQSAPVDYTMGND